MLPSASVLRASPSLTAGELQAQFLAYLDNQVQAGLCRPRTKEYYAYQLGKIIPAIADRPIAELVAYDLAKLQGLTWHKVQAMQRLFNWAVWNEIAERNPFQRVPKPRLGTRTRVLTRSEYLTLLRACDASLRSLLIGQREMIARPGEVRELRWADFHAETGTFRLKEFKGKDRRRDGAKFRLLLLSKRARRLIIRLYAQQSRSLPDGYVFHNRQGKAWTADALHNALRAVCRKLGWDDEPGERVVPYTIRHSAATDATAAGVYDRVLAEIMGHTNTRTTARYQHLNFEHLAEAIERATARQPRPQPPPNTQQKDGWITIGGTAIAVPAAAAAQAQAQVDDLWPVWPDIVVDQTPRSKKDGGK